MSSTLFYISRLFVLILVIIELCRNVSEGFHYRGMSFYLASIIFLLLSYLYEKKKRYFSIGFTFYFIVMYLSHLWGPYTYIYNKYIPLIEKVTPPDYYWIYWQTFMLVSLIILIYLVRITKINFDTLNKVSGNIELKYKLRSKQILLTMILLLPIWFLGMGHEVIMYLMVFFTTYFFSVYIFIPITRSSIYVKIGCLLSIAVILYIISWRFIFVKYAFPILFILILKRTSGKTRIDWKSIFGIGVCGIIVLIYGVVSEINKLNLKTSDLSLIAELAKTLTTWDTVEYWCNRQIYRIITIWTVLGGNMIEYIHQNGFFYGITYIKFLAPYFNFEYVSLPIISAQLIGASYAQTGAVVEGYANFGITGAVMNCILLFFIMEFFWDYFCRTRNILVLIIYLSSFSQVILDGGTINSIIFLCIISLFSFYILDVLKLRHKNNIKNENSTSIIHIGEK